MTTALITHPACLRHEPPPGHPERPGRLQSILTALEADEFRSLLRREAPEATLDQLSRVHDRDYAEEVLAAIPTRGVAHFDADTAVSPGSRDAILRAAGAVVEGVDMVMKGEVKNVFCAVRPPGHHALPDRAMGFCLFNNVAVGAAHARAVHGLARVAVIDFDVHHGNGTEAMFFSDPIVVLRLDASMAVLSRHRTPRGGAARAHCRSPVVGGCGRRRIPPRLQRNATARADDVPARYGVHLRRLRRPSGRSARRRCASSRPIISGRRSSFARSPRGNAPGALCRRLRAAMTSLPWPVRRRPMSRR